MVWEVRGQALGAITLRGGAVMRGSSALQLHTLPMPATAPPHHGYVGLLGSLLLPCTLFSLGYLSSRDRGVKCFL